MDKLIPICILIVIIIIGFISKMVDLSTIVKRIEFTSNYREKFVKFINKIVSENTLDQGLYNELTSDVKAMQYELGEDGVFAYMKDQLKGVAGRNYQLLINFLPETREMVNIDNSIFQYCIVPNECGGTNRTEYELLTSNSLSMATNITPFNTIDFKDANSCVSYLKSLGYYTHANHVMTGDNYNRKLVSIRK